MGTLCIAASVTLIHHLVWIMSTFGTLLIVTGVKLIVKHGKQV
jgi:predicted tellurium resistance membrane protein TerC